ncbi:helix-turn-helix domain-containing protein [Nonomuraea thailandensis]
MASLAVQLRQRRYGRQWTHERLAAEMTAVGVPWTRGIALDVETGERLISVAELVALAHVFGVGPGDLLTPALGLGYQVSPKGPVLDNAAARAWLRYGQAPPRHGEHPGALAPPPPHWPAEIPLWWLVQAWGLDKRVILRWAELGMLPGHRYVDGGPWWCSRDDVADFAGQSRHVRALKGGMVIRHATWLDGVPVRLTEVELVGGVRWSLGGRPTAGGDLVYAEPCRGDHIVLLVPAGDAP